MAAPDSAWFDALPPGVQFVFSFLIFAAFVLYIWRGYFGAKDKAAPSHQLSVSGAIVDNKAILPLISVLERIAVALERATEIAEDQAEHAAEHERERQIEKRIADRLKRDGWKPPDGV